MKFVLLLALVAVMAVAADGARVPTREEVGETVSGWWDTFVTHAKAARDTAGEYASQGVAFAKDTFNNVKEKYNTHLGN